MSTSSRLIRGARQCGPGRGASALRLGSAGQTHCGSSQSVLCWGVCASVRQDVAQSSEGGVGCCD